MIDYGNKSLNFVGEYCFTGKESLDFIWDQSYYDSFYVPYGAGTIIVSQPILLLDCCEQSRIYIFYGSTDLFYLVWGG